MDSRHILDRRRPRGQSLQPRGNAPGTVICEKVGIDVVGIRSRGHSLVTGHRIASRRISRLWHGLERDLPGPFVLASPAEDRRPAIRQRPHWDTTTIAIAIGAVHIGIHHIIYWFGPLAQGLLGLVRSAGGQLLLRAIRP